MARVSAEARPPENALIIVARALRPCLPSPSLPSASFIHCQSSGRKLSHTATALHQQPTSNVCDPLVTVAVNRAVMWLLQREGSPLGMILYDVLLHETNSAREKRSS
jgi:hypothetical protein